MRGAAGGRPWGRVRGGELAGGLRLHPGSPHRRGLLRVPENTALPPDGIAGRGGGGAPCPGRGAPCGAAAAAGGSGAAGSALGASEAMEGGQKAQAGDAARQRIAAAVPAHSHPCAPALPPALRPAGRWQRRA